METQMQQVIETMKKEMPKPKAKPAIKKEEKKEEKKPAVKKETKAKVKREGENPMRTIRIEKIILSCGATGKELDKAKKLLEFMSKMKAQVMKSSKRIPDFNVSPGMEVGVRVTMRGQDGIELLRRLLGALDNVLKKKQVAIDHFSFGIKEYIDIPGMEYQRDIGIRGLNITVVFNRPGIRVQRKKVKVGHLPKKQHVSQAEIIKYMEGNFKTSFK
jgi:large subunit ribosomal protein L5